MSCVSYSMEIEQIDRLLNLPKQEIRLIDNHEKDFYNEFVLIRSEEPK